MSPRVAFGALAQAEAVTWGFLLLGMFFTYVVGGSRAGIQVAGPVHGFVFLAFCLAVVLVAVDARWSWRRTATGLAAAVVPFATIPFESAVERSGSLPETWRLRSERGSTRTERLVHVALAAPVRAAVVTVVGLAVVFAALLAAGPPTQWLG